MKKVDIKDGLTLTRCQAMDLQATGAEVLYVSVPSQELAKKVSDNVENATFGMGFRILFEFPKKPS